MAPQLQILSNIVERLYNMEIPAHPIVYLYGIMYNDTLLILTFSINSQTMKNDENYAIHFTKLQSHLPADIYFCGILHIDENNDIDFDVLKDNAITTDTLLLLRYSRSTCEFVLPAYFYKHQKLEIVDNYSIIFEDDLSRQFVYIRLQATIPLIVQGDEILEALQDLYFNITPEKIGIHFPSSNTYLFKTDNNLKDTMLKDFLSISKDERSSTELNNVICNIGSVDIVHANMLMKISGNTESEEAIRYAPVLQHIKRSFDSLECKLHIDALSLVNLNMSLIQFHAILVKSIRRNIALIKMQERKSDRQIPTKIPTKLSEIMHFKPQDCGHLFTIAYPDNFTNDRRMKYRETLHKALALDLTRPHFRRGNAVKLDTKANEILINPHQALHKNGSGRFSIVNGLYSYHHYMQDNFDDNGWGCAYRSLQTIISWYRLQGYTEITIPSHREIQQSLVDIGDKPSAFIGSKQWIGSTEVSFVLQKLLDIDVKILCASSGEEMFTLIPQLENHFNTQGTPIMIGGGVLAHTILGVNYNERTEEGKFLILDPHYTGTDHLSTIINKGWCGWKTKDFWKKDAFYNMCLPQRPITF